MLLAISADMSSSFSSAWSAIMTVFYDVIDSLFGIYIGGVSLGVIWLSLNIMLTVIAVTITVVRNGVGNVSGSSVESYDDYKARRDRKAEYERRYNSEV